MSDPSSGPELLNRLVAERTEAHRRYNEALTLLDRAIQSAPALPALPVRWPDVLTPGTLAVHATQALARWLQSRSTHPQALQGLERPEQVPPWVHAALAGELPLLRAELECARWDRQDLVRWGVLLETLACLPRHWELPASLLDATSPPSPPRLIGACEAREPVIQALCEGLPFHLRAGQASRLARLANAAASYHPATPEKILDGALRHWVSPSRYWALRGGLSWSALMQPGGCPEVVSDWMDLPRAPAYRALDKLGTRILPSNFEPLPALPYLHAHRPGWPGWPDLLQRLQAVVPLPVESQQFLAHLRSKSLEASLPTCAPPPPSRSRL